MLIAMNLAKQPCCFAEPQSGSAQRLTAFRHQIIIITVMGMGYSASLEPMFFFISMPPFMF